MGEGKEIRRGHCKTPEREREEEEREREKEERERKREAPTRVLFFLCLSLGSKTHSRKKEGTGERAKMHGRTQRNVMTALLIAAAGRKRTLDRHTHKKILWGSFMRGGEKPFSLGKKENQNEISFANEAARRLTSMEGKRKVMDDMELQNH